MTSQPADLDRDASSECVPPVRSDTKRVYLAGAMEFSPDGGVAWRQEMTTFLREELGIEAFDPCMNELEVMDADERLHFRRWKSEDRPRFLQVIRRIIEHDLRNLRENTEFVVCLWDEHCQRGAGTAGELTVAHAHGIPVYVVTSIPHAELSSWMLGCATEAFDSFHLLKEFLREQVADGPWPAM